MSLHSSLTKNHKIENWTFANAGARTVAGLYDPIADIGKLAFQSDDGSYWRLTQAIIVGGGPTYTPTWANFGGSGTNPNRIENGYLITSLSGVEATSLKNKDVSSLMFGHIIAVTLNDSTGGYQYQNGVPDANKSDIVVASNANVRWRKTLGF